MFQPVQASLQALMVGVAVAVEVVHFLPEDAELHQARRHLCLQRTGLPLGPARRLGVASLRGEPGRLHPGLQASEGPQHFHNLRSGEVGEG